MLTHYQRKLRRRGMVEDVYAGMPLKDVAAKWLVTEGTVRTALNESDAEADCNGKTPWNPDNYTCCVCHRSLPPSDFPPIKSRVKNRKCLRCRKEACILRSRRRSVNRKSKSPQYRMWYRSRRSSWGKQEHNIAVSDVPTPKLCAYLGVELDYTPLEVGNNKLPRNLATIDRIDSSRGYIVGNIQVISRLANCMKQDATIEELVDFAKGVLRIHDPSALK